MSTSLDISEKDYQELEDHIKSDASVVGIDAKKTHILILHLLTRMQDRLDNIEQKLQALTEGN